MTEQKIPGSDLEPSEAEQSKEPAAGQPIQEAADSSRAAIIHGGRRVEPEASIASSDEPVVPDEAPSGIADHAGTPGEAARDSGQPVDPLEADEASVEPQEPRAFSAEFERQIGVLVEDRDQVRRQLASSRERERGLKAAAEAEATRCTELEKAFRQANRQLRQRDRRIEQSAHEIERLNDTASRLRKRNRVIKKSLAEAEGALVAEKRMAASLRRAVGKLTKKCEGYVHMDPVLAWLGSGLGDTPELFPSLLATIGSDPFPYRSFDNHLVSRGFELIWPGNGAENELVEVMIVGRDGWTEEQLEKQLAAREGHELKVYSQEMFLMSLAVGRDILSELAPADLKVIARDHPALGFLAEGELEWPNRMVPMLPKEFRPFDADGRAEASPLHVMGYAVGKTHGRPGAERRRLLSHAFEGEIPWVESKQYMDDWGGPRTRRRLWRVANHLAWLARSWRRMPSHHVAVKDWVADLAHLKREHYRPWMRFKWPEVRVPGE